MEKQKEMKTLQGQTAGAQNANLLDGQDKFPVPLTQKEKRLARLTASLKRTEDRLYRLEAKRRKTQEKLARIDRKIVDASKKKERL